MTVLHSSSRLGAAAFSVLAAAVASVAMPEVSLAAAPAAGAPNVIIFNIDDFGWGDLGVYGSKFSQTPNINALAAGGTRFTQFYSAPLCSPSRAGLMTGQFAARSNINTYIDSTQRNANVDNANSLAVSSPSMPRAFQNAGYATGHFGKWHLGGGRDVGYAQNPTPGTTVSAPRVVEYGYDKAWTQFEGLGDRVIFVNDYGGNANGTTAYPGTGYNEGLDQSSAARGTNGGQDKLVYLERQYGAEFFVNRAMEFIDSSKASSKPFFMNVWPDETHTPHDPPPALKAKYDGLYPSLPNESRNYLAVMEEMDRQFGRLVQKVHDAGLDDNTMIVVTADNGAEQTNANSIQSNGIFRGGKGDVWEGGIRDPLIVRWAGKVPAGQVNTNTVMAMTDLLPSLAAIGGTSIPAGLDGENLSAALLGDTSVKRTKDLYWGMNRGTENRYPNDGTEVVALRRGDMKLIIDADGKRPQLYNLAVDPGETSNLAASRPDVVGTLAKGVLDIRYSTPSLILPDTSKPVGRLRASDLLLGNGAAVTGWGDLATGDGVNFTVTQQGNAAARPTYRTNAINGKAAVRFDGNDVLESADNLSLPHIRQGITMFAVVSGDMTGGTAKRLAQLGDKNGTGGRSVGLDVSTSGTSTANGGAGFRFNNGSSLYDTGVDSQFHILIWQVDEGDAYADGRFYVDGTTPDHLFTGNSTNAAGALSLLGGDLQLVLGNGRSGGTLLPSDFFTGDLAEFLIYDQQLSLGEMNLVANYLSSEYALPFSYDSGFLLVPEPAAMGLAASGATLLLRRRR